MPEPRAKVVHFEDVPAEKFGDEAPGVTIRWLIDEENDGAPYYVMRMIEVAPDGHTPRHAHPFEHENYVLEGKGRLLVGEEWHLIKPGSVAFVPAGVVHTYENVGQEPLRFLCSIPATRLLE